MMKETEQHDGGRIEILDIFRGLAVCCILFNNILFFSGYEFLPVSQRNLFHASDMVIYRVVDFFITAKFYTLFSLLFGIGFYLQQKSFQNIATFKQTYKRRLFVLLVFGIIHSVCIWHGDILLLYSLMGFGLLLAIHKNNKTLLYWAMGLLVLVNLVGVLILLFYPEGGKDAVNAIAVAADPAHLDYPDMKNTKVLEEINSLDASRLFRINFHNLLWKWASYLLSFRPFEILGLFVLGYYLMRTSFLQTVLPRLSFLIVSGLIGITATLVFNDIGGSFLKFPSTWENEAYKFLSLAGHLGLCFFYMGLIYHVWQTNTGKRLFSFFIPIGKMALSCYILQSVLCISIFYIGRMAGRVSLGYVMLVAMGINSIIGLFASLWINKYTSGPLETIWRMGYQKN